VVRNDVGSLLWLLSFLFGVAMVRIMTGVTETADRSSLKWIRIEKFTDSNFDN